MTFKQFKKLVQSSRNVNQGAGNIQCPPHSLEMEYNVIKYRWPSQQERILVPRKQFKDSNKTLAGMERPKTEQDLVIPHSGHQVCYARLLRHHAK